MKTGDQSKTDETRDPDFSGAEAALYRAARRARQRANISRARGMEQLSGGKKLSFSQAEGYEEIPEPLKLEELSSTARTQIWNLLYVDLDESSKSSPVYYKKYIAGYWAKILKNVHCSFDNLAVDDWQTDFEAHRTKIRRHIESDPFNRVFDRLQFIIRDKSCSLQFIRGLKRVFEQCSLAYTIDENRPPTIFAVATPEEGTALIESLQTLRKAGLEGSSSHLRNAAQNINQRDWAGGVRESIHAVESVARKIDPKASRTLTPALKSIESQGALHSSLKEAFIKLYWYTSDQKGIRHALLDSPQAKVGAEEAVFMLGACASFASYLWRKHIAAEGP